MPPQSWAVRRDSWARPDEQAVAPAAPVPFWSSVTRNYEDGWETRRRNARYQATDSALWDRHRELERRLGRRLELSRSLAGVTPGASERSLLDRITFDPEAINAAILGRPGLLEDDAYEAMIEAERAKNPGLLEGVESRDQIAARLEARFRETRARADEAAEGGAGGAFGAFVGQVGAAFSDPVNLGLAISTGGLGAGRTLLARMAAQGGVGAGQEILEAPGRAQDAERFGGPEYTAGEAALDVLFAGAGAAGFEVGGDLIRQGWRAGARRLAASAEPGDRGMAAAIDRLLEDEAVIGPGQDFDGARAGLDRGVMPAIEPDRDLDDLFGPEVLAGVSPTQPASATGGGGLASVDYRGRRIWAGQFDPMALEVDAERFQYKAEADAEGVTGRLRGVEQWDATASGKILVFEDLEGRRFVADGHQRRGLARRMVEQGWEGTQLDGHMFREADGWTAREVRIVAALKNIREGSGTIMDAAKLFRDAPGALRDRSLPVTGDFIHQARQLAGLSEDAFRAVVNGVIPERYGAVLGEMAGDRPDLHGDLVNLLKKGDPKSVDGARALVQEAMLDDFIATEGIQGDLFGSLPRESTLIARGKIREAVLAGLRRDARILGQLVKHAEAIEAGGNVLARSENEARLAVDRAAGELVSRLALRSGEIGEAFADAAEAVTLRKSTPAAAAKGLIARIRAAVEAGELADMARAEALNPRPPSEAAVTAAKAFDTPGGAGQKAQAAPKPEDAELETPRGIAEERPGPAAGPDADAAGAREAGAGVVGRQGEPDAVGDPYFDEAAPAGWQYDPAGGLRADVSAAFKGDLRDPIGSKGRENAMDLDAMMRGIAVRGETPGDVVEALRLDLASVDEALADVDPAISRNNSPMVDEVQQYRARQAARLKKAEARAAKAAAKAAEQYRADAVAWQKVNDPEAIGTYREGVLDEDLVAAYDRALAGGALSDGRQIDAEGRVRLETQRAEAVARIAARAGDASPAPEPAAEAQPAGLFDDLPDEEVGLKRAIDHLNACAPGKG